MRRRTRAVAIAAAVTATLTASVAAAVVPTIDRAVTGGATAERVAVPHRALVIGDSALASLRWATGSANVVVGFDHTLDLETCRRLYTLSCPGRTGAPPPTAYETLARYGTAYDVLVLAVGYNEFPLYMAESFARVVERARSLGYHRIVWWTLRNNGPSTNAGRNDRTVRDLVAGGGYPDVVLADWAAYSAGHPEWFVADGVHYQLAGAYAAADYLSRKMAAIDGRVCPVPTTPTGPSLSPCPDPDRAGPTAALPTLYPLGVESVLCYERDPVAVGCQLQGIDLALTRELREGAAGRDVEALQHRLRRLGRLAAVTGVYDGATQAAVVAWADAHGLRGRTRADRDVLASLGFDVSGVR